MNRYAHFFISQRLAKIVFGLTMLLMLTPATALAKSDATTGRVSVLPVTVASVAQDCTKPFFGLEPWYNFLPDDDFYGSNNQNVNPCSLKCFNLTEQPKANDCGQTKSDLPLILLAVIDDLLRITGMVAVAFVLYGGFQYVSSQGNPDATTRAQGTILNALIGLALAIVSILIVSYIGNAVGG